MVIIHIIYAVILGIVEGVTEFLPISSTGHLIIVNHWVHFGTNFTESFDVVIQLGAILSVIVYFWKKLIPRKNPIINEKEGTFISLWSKIIVAVIPAIILGLLFGNIIEHYLFNSIVVAIMLIIGGVVLIVLEGKKREVKIVKLRDLSLGKAFAIGWIQCFAMIPGTSRSASTIIGGMLLGGSREVAAEFSFFLAIPTMILASGYTVLKHGAKFSHPELGLLAIGFIVSFVVALIVISAFMGFIKKNSFKGFGYYRIGLGIVILVLFGLHII